MDQKKLENEVERYLFNAVKKIGGKAVKFIPDNERGMPDRLLLLPHGRIVWVELKRPKGGKVSAAQLLKHEELRRLEFQVEVIKNKDEVDELIKLVK